MNVAHIAFAGFAAASVVAGGYLLFARNLFKAALALLVVLLSVAALFILANAEFVGASQIMVYAGGILILIIFGIMLTGSHENIAYTSNTQRISGVSIALVIFTGLAWLVSEAFANDNIPIEITAQPQHTTQTLGFLLMTNYLPALELVAVMLLAALVGASYLAGRK